jgi:hypothetical protein
MSNPAMNTAAVAVGELKKMCCGRESALRQVKEDHVRVGTSQL